MLRGFSTLSSLLSFLDVTDKEPGRGLKGLMPSRTPIMRRDGTWGTLLTYLGVIIHFIQIFRDAY